MLIIEVWQGLDGQTSACAAPKWATKDHSYRVIPRRFTFQGVNILGWAEAGSIPNHQLWDESSGFGLFGYGGFLSHGGTPKSSFIPPLRGRSWHWQDLRTKQQLGYIVQLLLGLRFSDMVGTSSVGKPLESSLFGKKNVNTPVDKLTSSNINKNSYCWWLIHHYYDLSISAIVNDTYHKT